MFKLGRSDNYTSWHTLKYNNAMAIGLSLSGVYNFGHDIGGFLEINQKQNYFLRWVQCGAYYPRFSIHSWNDDGTVNEPWMHQKYYLKLNKPCTSMKSLNHIFSH